MKLPLGGQAVIEGVMIKSPRYVVTSVRTPKGTIASKQEKLAKKGRIAQLPFVRGVVNMYEMLSIGYRALLWSAQASGEDDEKISSFDIGLSLLLSIAFALGLFLVLPFFLTKLLYGKTTGVIFNLIDGLLRVAIFLLYLLAISRMKDIKRLFQYHGAEHQAVNCYEAGKPVSAANVKKHSPIHRRCGTNFIMIVLLVSIFLFSFITTGNFLYNILLRIVLIPLVAAVSYELLKLADKYPASALAALVAPGIWLQRLTTAKPTGKQVQVAVNSVLRILKLERG